MIACAVLDYVQLSASYFPWSYGGLESPNASFGSSVLKNCCGSFESAVDEFIWDATHPEAQLRGLCLTHMDFRDSKISSDCLNSAVLSPFGQWLQVFYWV